jgi:oxaloacetate decarboxylase alpha subunit
MPGGEVDGMVAAAPPATHYNPDLQPVLRLLRELAGRRPAAELTVDKPGFRLSVRGGQRD